jgi:DNA repair protein RadC
MQVRELRLSYVPVPGLRWEGRQRIVRATDAVEVFRVLLEPEAVEVFALLLVNTKHRPLAVQVVSRGALDSTVVHPRDVFKVALLANASAVITAHNHPSGDPTPSADDRALWTRLDQAAAILGIDVLDHLVIGHDGAWFSQRMQR